MRVETYRLAANGSIPNNPDLPLLVYPAVFDGSPEELGAAFERRFDACRWPAAWRNGIHPYHHYHCSAHEVLGIFDGHIEVCFGGEGGPVVAVSPGDVVIIPAGVSHRRVSLRGRIGVVGAYPAGQSPDLCRGTEDDHPRHRDLVARVPLPSRDPVHGDGGPLYEHWRLDVVCTVPPRSGERSG